MPVAVSISIDPAQLAEMRRVLDPKQFKQAQYQAVRRTTNAARRIVENVVTEKVNLTRKYARRAVTSRVASENGVNTGAVTITQRPIPLIGYRPKVSKRGGVTVTISLDRAPVFFRHAFKATVRTLEQVIADEEFEGHTGIFQRARGVGEFRGAGGNRRGVTPEGFAHRLPIKELRGPSVLDVVEIPDVEKRVTEELGDALSRNVQSQIDRFVKSKQAAAEQVE